MVTKRKLLEEQKNLGDLFNTWMVKWEGRKTRETEEARINILDIREKFNSNHHQLLKLGVDNESYFTSNYYDEWMHKITASLEKYNAEREEAAESNASNKDYNLIQNNHYIKPELEDQ
ncbi:unnamed protein product [Ceratitis capitata]|uniref:(Mediterranean fruit fly) hypothetical protein n=1 Tax=Ceratitis capitata TaxID=7213 RepID=A0A811UT45_CERCA|nr:unnamed protein product [Ceratitis capitata]